MASNYSMGWVNTTTNFQELLKGASDANGGLPAIALLLMIFLVSFLAFLKKEDSTDALIISFFITWISSLALWAGTIIAFWVTTMCLTLFIGSITKKLIWG